METFGSMEREEKVRFILEQMRLGLARNDYIRTQIISKKISIKFFATTNDSDVVQVRVHREILRPPTLLLTEWEMSRRKVSAVGYIRPSQYEKCMLQLMLKCSMFGYHCRWENLKSNSFAICDLRLSVKKILS